MRQITPNSVMLCHLEPNWERKWQFALTCFIFGFALPEDRKLPADLVAFAILAGL
jgi:hypothetical protein